MSTTYMFHNDAPSSEKVSPANSLEQMSLNRLDAPGEKKYEPSVISSTKSIIASTQTHTSPSPLKQLPAMKADSCPKIYPSVIHPRASGVFNASLTSVREHIVDDPNSNYETESSFTLNDAVFEVPRVSSVHASSGAILSRSSNGSSVACTDDGRYRRSSSINFLLNSSFGVNSISNNSSSEGLSESAFSSDYFERSIIEEFNLRIEEEQRNSSFFAMQVVPAVLEDGSTIIRTPTVLQDGSTIIRVPPVLEDGSAIIRVPPALEDGSAIIRISPTYSTAGIADASPARSSENEIDHRSGREQAATEKKSPTDLIKDQQQLIPGGLQLYQLKMLRQEQGLPAGIVLGIVFKERLTPSLFVTPT
jgi:hypothetical protein